MIADDFPLVAAKELGIRTAAMLVDHDSAAFQIRCVGHPRLINSAGGIILTADANTVVVEGTQALAALATREVMFPKVASVSS